MKKVSVGLDVNVPYRTRGASIHTERLVADQIDNQKPSYHYVHTPVMLSGDILLKKKMAPTVYNGV